jgi:penicillin-binding protein 2
MNFPFSSKNQVQKWRGQLFTAILLLSALALVSKLISLQFFEYNIRLAQANENRTLEISIPPSRGIIYDRNGFILARNAASYNVVIVPAELPNDDGDIQNVYRTLSAIINVPVNNGTLDEAKLVSSCVSGPGITQLVELQNSLAPYSPVRIQCNIPEKLAMTITEKSMDMPGVGIEVEPIRDYPTGALTSNIIGFLGPIPSRDEELYAKQGFQVNRDKVGYSGLEAFFQDVLAGVPGKKVVERDVAGQAIRNLEPPRDAESGYNIVTTIDTRLQKATEAAMLKEINFWNTYFNTIRITTAAVIAMNPTTGEILAMTSYPTYENNRFARFIPAYYYNQLFEEPAKPMLNHAVSDQFPPGSVFKLSTATGALNEGVVTLDQIIDAPGELRLTESFSPNDPGNERAFVDWNEAGFGTIDFLRCIAYSSNVCFYKLGGGYKDEIKQGLGIERLREYARALGYDEPSYIELLGEAKGLIPYPQWKRINRGENWSTGDTYIASVGQGYVISTPLQVLMSAATIANDGKLVQPTLIKEIKDQNDKVVEIWRDNEGNLYRTCKSDIPEVEGEENWCDTGFGISNTAKYQKCSKNDTFGAIIKGWCSKDDKGADVFKTGSWQISPQTVNVKWDITKDLVITNYSCDGPYCTSLETKKSVRPDVVESIQRGMRLAVTSSPTGTLFDVFNGGKEFANPFDIPVAGKTGTAEYCDDVAQKNNRCTFGAWPTHSWTVAYAPYDSPEIAVVAFFYNGGEGASVAAPVVRRVMEAYFELKKIDQPTGTN